MSRWGTWLLLIVAALWLTSCSAVEQRTGSDDDTETSGERAALVAELDGEEQPLLVYRRSGEEEGQSSEWRVYSEGRVAVITPGSNGQPEVAEAQIEEEAVDQLLTDLENAGFFEVAEAEVGECCTQNNYAITVWQDGEAQSVTVDQITPQMSPQRLASINYVERFVYQEVTLDGEQ